MLTPITQELYSSKSPWEVFCSVYARQERCFFLDSHLHKVPDQNYSYIGFDPFLTLTLEKGSLCLCGEIEASYPEAELFPVLRGLMKRYQSNWQGAFFSGGAVGYLTYEMAEHFEKIKFEPKEGWTGPKLCFGFHRDLIVYDHARKCYILVTHIEAAKSFTEQQTSAQERLQALGLFLDPEAHAKAAALDSAPADQNVGAKAIQPEMSKQQFIRMVGQAKDYIAAGDIYQANLSQRFNFEFHGSVLNLYEDLRTINPSPFSSFFKWDDFQIISSSPERLVSKRGRHCETRPIAGTRPVYPSPVPNLELERELLGNTKERAEHVMLVDLERNDLGRVCDYASVRVAQMMVTERYSHVIHIVSKIVGTLAEDKDMFDLMEAMFPGGTITGCPKVRCMEIIDQLEPTRRGLYTGSIGYLGFNGDLDLNIVIRTLILNGKYGHLQVGAGIVYDSDPEKEYEETLHKGEALMQALSGVSAV